VNSPQRCVYVMPCGSNIDVARCGWDVKKYEQWRIKDCRIQSAAALWLRHALRALFVGDSLPVDCHARYTRSQ
ncbi:MAG: hypothetical protein K2N70_07510, partial [Helicobacter sp.]|nr:hypothetical protein [Helicobacter sp.]